MVLVETAQSIGHRAMLGAAAVWHRHQRRIAVTASVLLAGTAVTAFGIAPMAPDAAQLPRRQIVEPIDPPGLPTQLLALASYDMVLSRADQTRASDSVESLLRRLGVFDPQLATFMRANNETRRLFEGRPGKQVQARTSGDGRPLELVARFAPPTPELANTHFTRLTIRRDGDQWRADSELAPLDTQVRVSGGTIETSLFAATDEAHLSDQIAIQMVELFSGDIDFHRELRRGDTFSVVYESLSADGQPVSWADDAGRVLGAEFVNGGKVYQVMWYAEPGDKGGYYGFDGRSRRRTFLASPVAFSRVTSGFSMRMHPILNTWRQHGGVDYAAPTGTPVRVVGDGWVQFAGWQNGYGNVVQVAHGNDRQTLYAHLSRIEVRQGQRVEQGQRIGLVGATGWATGPHLHFEFRVHGQHQDPTRIARSAETVQITAALRPRFEEAVREVQQQLDIAETLRDSPGQGE
ncbi:MAG TPA: peptidoglycan DD-metalloendopeptidase family protein [Burkholderiaceae bacterium]|nr:peptidoglycan DD-metalloendopeptidase family protein [Burkholderiaceae bacterium]